MDSSRMQHSRYAFIPPRWLRHRRLIRPPQFCRTRPYRLNRHTLGPQYLREIDRTTPAEVAHAVPGLDRFER